MRMSRAVSSVIAILLLAAGFITLPGCKKVSDQEKIVLQTTATAAKERASAFAVIKAQLVAKDVADHDAVARWIVSHGSSLNAEAIGVANLVAAVQGGSGLSANARDALTAEAQNAAARAMDLRLMTPKLALDPGLTDWIAKHQAALDDQTRALNKLAGLIVSDAAPK